MKINIDKVRQIHLLESKKVEEYITTYPKDGDNIITPKIGKKNWELFDTEKQLGRIWINEEQYFDNIPVTAWELLSTSTKMVKRQKTKRIKF